MSAMPRPQQMERVLENLAPETKVASARKLQPAPPWRVVSRDGSTSSLASLSEAAKAECPDCLAGRCGQNPQGCRCSASGGGATISLERVTTIPKPKTIPASSLEAAPGPTMPQAKPQLFGRGQPSPVDFLQSPRREHEGAATPVPASSGNRVSLPHTCRPTDSASPDPSPSSSASKFFGDDLQKVVDRWPRLSRSTRRAILLLVSTSNEADSA